MAKLIYELNQSGKFSAFYLDQDKFSYFGFCKSKRLSLDFIPRFEIEAKSTNKNQKEFISMRILRFYHQTI